MERTNGTDTALFFLAGGLVGAGIALLYAPRSGQELRGLISERVREGTERGRELGARAADRSRELLQEARHGLEWQKERLAAAVQAGKETYQEEKSQA